MDSLGHITTNFREYPLLRMQKQEMEVIPSPFIDTVSLKKQQNLIILAFL